MHCLVLLLRIRIWYGNHVICSSTCPAVQLQPPSPLSPPPQQPQLITACFAHSQTTHGRRALINTPEAKIAEHAAHPEAPTWRLLTALVTAHLSSACRHLAFSSQGVAVQLGLVCTVMCPGRGSRNLGYAAYAVDGLPTASICDIRLALGIFQPHIRLVCQLPAVSRCAAPCMRHRAACLAMSCIIVFPALDFLFLSATAAGGWNVGGGHVWPESHVIWGR